MPLLSCTDLLLQYCETSGKKLSCEKIIISMATFELLFYTSHLLIDFLNKFENKINIKYVCKKLLEVKKNMVDKIKFVTMREKYILNGRRYFTDASSMSYKTFIDMEKQTIITNKTIYDADKNKHLYIEFEIFVDNNF